MSFNVLIIPEDFRKDQAILKPIIEALFTYLGKPRANVNVCRDPQFGGISNVTDWAKISPVLNRYRGSIQLILLLVDRDGNENRRASLDHLETLANENYPTLKFIAENAWQEVEVWALAGCGDLPTEWAWKDIRSDRDPKERFFSAYSQMRGFSQLEHEGRKEIATAAAAQYTRIRTLCPEDIQELETKIKQILF